MNITEVPILQIIVHKNMPTSRVDLTMIVSGK